MVARLIMQPGRIIVSRAGFSVSTGMPDSQKLFDSDWNWSGVLLEAGVVVDPGGGDMVIPFTRNYGYVPAVIARQLAASAYSVPWSGYQVVTPGYETNATPNLPGQIYSDRIVLPRTSGVSYGTVEYEVFGLD